MIHAEWTEPEFDPHAEEEALVGLIRGLLQAPPGDDSAWRNLMRQFPKSTGGFFAKAEIMAGFRVLGRRYDWGVEEEGFIKVLVVEQKLNLGVESEETKRPRRDWKNSEMSVSFRRYFTRPLDGWGEEATRRTTTKSNNIFFSPGRTDEGAGKSERDVESELRQSVRCNRERI